MISRITFVLALVISVATFAKNPSLSVSSASSSVYNVAYKAVEAGKVKVSIYNDNNELVFTETLNAVSSFNRPYNFSELAEGEYTIVLESKNDKQAEKVSYRSNKVTTYISMKEVADSANKYQLNLTSSTTDAVSVKIYNASDALVHEQKMKVTGRAGFIFDLNKVKSDMITFEISTSNGNVERITF
jgi:hypothetical protein